MSGFSEGAQRRVTWVSRVDGSGEHMVEQHVEPVRWITDESEDDVQKAGEDIELHVTLKFESFGNYEQAAQTVERVRRMLNVELHRQVVVEDWYARSR